MRNITLNNTEVLDSLNEYKDFIMNNNIEKYLHLQCYDKKKYIDYYTGPDYLKKILSQGENHQGLPEAILSYTGLIPAKPGEKKINKTSMEQAFTNASLKLNSNLMEILAAKTNTLNTVYPPGGFISWHNNANASGYNILFSWSENGKGSFSYWDLKTQKIVTIPDVPGWQCKMGYFGSYDDPETLCYHSAKTECWRISVAYVFNEADSFWKEVINDIENPI